jgi:zinc transporter 2
MALALGHNHHHHHDHGHSHEIGEESARTTSTFSLAVEDLNLRAALIHVLGDLLQSIGVVIASALIWYQPSWRVADPICTLLFSVIVFVTTIFISRDIVRILMEGIQEGNSLQHPLLLRHAKGN